MRFLGPLGCMVAPSLFIGGIAALSIRQDTTQAVLITSDVPSDALAECLKAGYYGAYGGSLTQRDFIYLPARDCLEGDKNALTSLNSGSLSYIDQADIESGDKLVWVGQAGLAPEVQAATGLQGISMMDHWKTIQSRAKDSLNLIAKHTRDQSHFSSSSPRTLRLVHASPVSLLLAVPASYVPILDTLLPTHLVPVALPQKPFAQAVGGLAWEPVPKHLAENLANITDHLEFDSDLDRLLNEGLDIDQLRRDVRWLTGEGPSGIETRHSFTEGAVKAAHYIKGVAEKSGASCELHHFLPGFAPNVLCTYPSTRNSTENVILSAHYDSRGSFGLTRAPGGDDDGSGSGHLLQIARAVGKLGIKFEKKVTFAWHAGEEQGLYGSHYFAERLKKENATVLLQIQADMLGYHAPGEPLQLGLPESIETPEASALLHALAQLYSPELVLGKTSACCSDHQSFLALGFPATAVFERNGWIADPMYHNSGDLSQRDGYDLTQIISIAKVTMAGVMSVAGWSVGK